MFLELITMRVVDRPERSLYRALAVSVLMAGIDAHMSQER